MIRSEFVECPKCIGRPGSPDLCRECVERRALFEVVGYPIQMLLTCPVCGERHIDAGVFETKPHHTHACQFCGTVWRPAINATVGVRFLPGFKDGV